MKIGLNRQKRKSAMSPDLLLVSTVEGALDRLVDLARSSGLFPSAEAVGPAFLSLGEFPTASARKAAIHTFSSSILSRYAMTVAWVASAVHSSVGDAAISAVKQCPEHLQGVRIVSSPARMSRDCVTAISACEPYAESCNAHRYKYVVFVVGVSPGLYRSGWIEDVDLLWLKPSDRDPGRDGLDGAEVGCRAEWKLRELAARRILPAAPASKCLDVGCAPGSWSAYIADQGLALSVCAVDSAEFTVPVSKAGVVTHVRKTIQAAAQDGDLDRLGPFDMVMSDANIEPIALAPLLEQAVWPRTEKGAFVVITLKHPRPSKKEPRDDSYLPEVMRIIGESVDVLWVGWLLANTRSERTIVGRKK